MKAALVALASLGVVAGLAVTASSTSAQAYAAGMRGLALAAIVVVLECTNILGTLVWLKDSRSHAKWQAGVLVGCASVVTAWCGALTYGPIGLVGPFFVLVAVHLANLASTRPSSDVPSHRHTGMDTGQAVSAVEDVPSMPADEAAALGSELGVPVAPRVRLSKGSPCSVYRLIGDDETLLYVGKGMYVRDRLKAHRDDKAWWSEVARIDVTEYASEDEALFVEAAAIATENPVYNRIASPGPWPENAPDSPPAPVGEETIPASDIPPRPPQDEATEQQDADIRAWVHARGEELGRTPGRDMVRREFGIGSRRAERLLTEAAAERRPRLVTGGGA